MKQVLVRCTNWIGDAVMSLAALRELRRLQPQARLTLLAREWVAPIFEGQGVADQVVTLENRSLGVRGVFRVGRRLRGFDTAVLFQNAFEAALLALTARIPNRIGYTTDGRRLLLTQGVRPRIKDLGRHQTYYYLDLLFQAGVSSIDYLEDSSFRPDIHLTPSRAQLESADSLLGEAGVESGRPLVGLNPGAAFGSAKRWFPERYAEVADRLIEEAGAEVVLLGSSSETPIAVRVREQMKQTPRFLVGRTSLSALIGVLARCRLFLGNDSGPMHLSAALGVPLVAVFGSTDEVATGPLSPQATVIHKHVECSPCLLRECPIDLRCFDRIHSGEVYRAARRLLTRNQAPGRP
ncbi:MAG: lipopolysaccharide heptosyltransferase II [Acidobacteriota bacterium]|nr:lipopolysaccharide heptosyltransferase II [Acidobacteriota bacterium]